MPGMINDLDIHRDSFAMGCKGSFFYSILKDCLELPSFLKENDDHEDDE